MAPGDIPFTSTTPAELITEVWLDEAYERLGAGRPPTISFVHDRLNDRARARLTWLDRSHVIEVDDALAVQVDRDRRDEIVQRLVDGWRERWLRATEEED